MDFSIFQRNGSGNYLVQFTNPNTGRRTQVSTRTANKRDASRKAEQIIEQYTRPTPTHTPPSGGLMCGLIEEWQHHAASTGIKYAHRTAIQVRSFMDRAGVLQVQDLSAKKINSFVTELLASGLAPSTVRQYLSQVKGVLNWAVEHDKLSTLPKIATVRASSLQRRRERGVLTTPELGKLISLIVSTEVHSPRWSALQRASIYQLAANTGLRRGELCSLTVDDIDLKNKLLTVRGSISKNNKTVQIPLNAKALEAIKWAVQETKTRQLYTGDPKRITEYLKQDLKRANISDKKGDLVIDFHAFRSYFITNLIRSGVDIKTTQTLARHSTPTLTLQAYAKTDMKLMKSAVDLI